MAAKVESGEDAPTKPAVVSVNSNGQGRPAPATRRPNRRVMALIGLGMASRLLRDPRFQARVITAAFALAMIRRAARESLTHNFEHVSGFLEGNRLRLEDKAKKAPAKLKAR